MQTAAAAPDLLLGLDSPTAAATAPASTGSCVHLHAIVCCNTLQFAGMSEDQSTLAHMLDCLFGATALVGMLDRVCACAHFCHHALADPFAALGGEAQSPAAAPVAPPNLVDLDDMYSAAVPPQTPFSQVSSLDHAAAQSQAAAMYGAQMPHMTGGISQPAVAPQLQMPTPPQPKAAPVVGGPAPMAPRGNAAVEQHAGRKDPFADLFS